MLKNILIICVIALIVLSITACGKVSQEIPATTVEETEEAEIFVTTQIIQNGTCDYTIVHDGKMGTAKLATEIKSMISAAYGINLEVCNAAQAKEGGKQITVGNVGASGEKAMKKLKGEFDFTMRVEENKLVLCAKNDLSYSYLGQYLKREVFVKSDSAELTLDSDDNIVYSQSALMQTNFVDYWLEENQYLPFKEHFAHGMYQNKEITLPYRIYVPFNYTPEKSYPLVLGFHGAGHRGNDNDSHLLFIDQVMKNPALEMDEAIIIYPQCPAEQRWVNSHWGQGSYDLDTVGETVELKAVMELVEQLQQTYSIDKTRIYSVGYSMGGYATWNLLQNHPDVFAAGIAMCGAGDPSKASLIKDIPVWAIHGVLDPTVPVSGSRDMAAAMEAVGAKDFHYTELPEADHDVWTYTFANAEIFAWLFSQKKPA